MNTLSHVDDGNRPRMVDVSGKSVTGREARAQSRVWLPPPVLSVLEDGELNSKKGPVFATAIVAGVMAAKKTHELIPFCHPLGLDRCDVEVRVVGDEAVIDCTCSVEHKTGVEMEALTGASVAALTVYDMVKALSHEVVIRETRLMKKTGGKEDFERVE